MLGMLLIAFCMLLAIVIIQNAQAQTRHQLQRALDEQCGHGKVSEGDGSYHYDPILTWSSPKVYCYTDIGSQKFICDCKNTQ